MFPQNALYILDITHFRVLSYKVYIYIPKEDRVISYKIVLRVYEGILVGYKGHYIFRVYIKSKTKVIRSLNVTFDEGGLITKPLEDDFTGRAKEKDPTLRSRIRGKEVSDTKDSSSSEQDNDKSVEVLESRFLIKEQYKELP